MHKQRRFMEELFFASGRVKAQMGIPLFRTCEPTIYPISSLPSRFCFNQGVVEGGRILGDDAERAYVRRVAINHTNTQVKAAFL